MSVNLLNAENEGFKIQKVKPYLMKENPNYVSGGTEPKYILQPVKFNLLESNGLTYIIKKI